MAEEKKNSIFNRMKRLFRKLTGRNDPHPPPYPFADKLAPVGQGPRNRSGAVALQEPPPPTNTDARGR